ncbi:hypothetical protein BSKO_04432 [Bryopsis sp. KO-2023]|nr:hypothetical protein BSKO_04432 [Bryopsis sp. KO-2023]
MEQPKKIVEVVDAMSGMLTGADAQSRLVMIEQKLDAIMDFLGMTRQWPVQSSQGAVRADMSNTGSHEPYMVFRNVAFENQSQNAPQKVVMESETSGSAKFAPRPHSAAAAYDFGSGSYLVSNSQPQTQGKVTPPFVNAKESQSVPPRHSNVFSGRAPSHTSSSDFFEFTDSIASSARSSRDGCRDSLNSGKQSGGTVSVTIFAEDTRESMKKTVATFDSVSGEPNKSEVGRSSRSGLYTDAMCPQNREVQNARNKTRKDWKDMGPTRPYCGSSGVSSESCTTTSVKSEGPNSKRDLSRGMTSRSCTPSGSSRSSIGGSKSRRDLLRTASARDNHSPQSLRGPASGKKQESCSNAEVVRQIKEKIMEIRQKDGTERKSRDGPPEPKPQQKEEPIWFSEAWDRTVGKKDDIVDIPDIDDMFPRPPRFAKPILAAARP